MRVYICGPMRQRENFNFDSFDAAAETLRAEGHTPINPAAIDRATEGWLKYPPENSEFSREDCTRFMLRDLAAISHCDAIYLLEGWSASKGVAVELSFARFLGLDILPRREGGDV